MYEHLLVWIFFRGIFQSFLLDITVESFPFHQKYFHIVFAFDKDFSSWFKFESFAIQKWDTIFADLNATSHTGRIHSAANIHRIAPNVEMQFARSNDTRCHIAHIESNAQN